MGTLQTQQVCSYLFQEFPSLRRFSSYKYIKRETPSIRFYLYTMKIDFWHTLPREKTTLYCYFGESSESIVCRSDQREDTQFIVL